MKNQYKLLAEKYVQVLETEQEPVTIRQRDGTIISRLNGKLHRLDGPAVVFSNGTKQWYQNNKFHRLDGPAIISVDGTKHWFVNGMRHRLDGPAIEWADGTKEWYIDGNRHRLDGPAIERADGTKEWWIGDEEYSEDEFNKEIQRRNILKKSSDETGIEMDI